MKLNNTLSLFLALILFVSACSAVPQANSPTREMPTDSPWSKNGIVYEKPVWKMVKGEFGVDVVSTVRNNNNQPTEVIFHYELYGPNGNLISTCSNTTDRSSILDGDNSIVSSNGTATMQCAHKIYAPVNASDTDSYNWKHGVIVIPLDEIAATDISVLETGFDKTEEYAGIVSYIVHARIQSGSDKQVTTRFYVLDNEGVQFIGCETDSELRNDAAVRVECRVTYNTDKINQAPASLIVDVIEWEQ